MNAPVLISICNRFSVSDEIQRVLGFDWLLLFVQGHLHRTSVVSAMRILLIMLGHQGTMTKFREGNSVGGWLDDAEIVLENRTGVIAGNNTIFYAKHLYFADRTCIFAIKNKSELDS